MPLIDADRIVDEGSDEAILKKFKQLEDRFSKSEDSNKALMAEVKSLRQKQGSARNHASDDEDSHSDSNEADSDSDIAHRSDDPSTLFSSRKVSALTSVIHGRRPTDPANRYPSRVEEIRINRKANVAYPVRRFSKVHALTIQLTKSPYSERPRTTASTSGPITHSQQPCTGTRQHPCRRL